MNSSDIPTKLPIPFASAAGGGYIRAIPTNSQIGIVDGAASLHDGFVPLNATPIGAGGVPPDIKDMNGVLYEISGWSRWQAAGGPVYYDAVFAAAIGGYPKGAVVQSVVTPGFFFYSTADANTTNPEGVGAANWGVLIVERATDAEALARTETAKYLSPANLPILTASSAEILAGTEARKFIAPDQFFASRASGSDVLAGANDHKYITPAALAAAVGGSLSTPDGSFRFPGGLILNWCQDTFPDVPAGGVGYAATKAFATAFPTAVLSAMISTRLTSGTICNWNASIEALTLSTVSWRVEEWAASVNPGGVTIWALGY